MRLTDLWRHTPARMAAGFAGILLCSLVLVGVPVFFSMSSDLEEMVERQMHRRLDTLSAVYDRSGQAELSAMVAIESRQRGEYAGITGLFDAKGVLLEGTPGLALPAREMSTQTIQIQSADGEDEDDDDDEQQYLLLSRQSANLHIVVGEPIDELVETRQMLVNGFLAAGALTALLSMIGGVLLSRRLQRRFDTLDGALKQFADGQFDTQLPLSPRRDDIDGFLSSINQALSRVRRLVESLRQVSTDIAHDLKTPMGRLLIWAEDALGQDDLSTGARASLVKIRDEAVGINQTFDALLSVARVKGEITRERFADVSLHDAVEEIVEIYGPVAADENVELKMQSTLASTASLISGDLHLLRQMVVNLLENAIKHGQSLTRIDVSLALISENRIRLSVADNGIGVPASEHDKVLERLYRVERSRSTPGSGLGLHLVAVIVEAHDATINLSDNAPGLRIEIDFERSQQSAEPNIDQEKQL